MSHVSMMFPRYALVVVAVAALAACATTPSTQKQASYYLSVQDGRAGLNDGKPVVRKADDSLAVVELSGGQLRVAQQVTMPTSLVGPPSSIAIALGGRVALVSASTRRDPADASKVVTYDLVSIVALDPSGATGPRVVGSVHTGAGASGISINRAGNLALVANRTEGSVSVLSIEGEKVEVVGKVQLGEKAGPAHVAFTSDGRRALVSRDGDNRVSLLAIDGRSVTLEQREVYAGLRPYGLDISPDGSWAAVTNLGGGQGDADTISLIDLRAKQPRVVDTVTVGQTPEGIFFSPDSRSLGVTVIDGSNKPQNSPFHGTARYRLFTIEDSRLRPTAQVVGGQWLQGHAFSPDGSAVLVQDAANRQIRLYRNTSGTLADSGERLQMYAAPSALKLWR
ncbi:YncE family protein [Cupriavidus sp. SW-Y-13]|uniref:YncE family protein n=1 Tax=Cupriavidus sp. SW-Y-13 TaxID=2653854 RepID=UPI0013659D60|nr:YncE family protein [Cupriavidus sp. SW-Y-13]MWL91516.1 beta-propeller fold lactonase family protein [Cupriavidus sp. SW-Y-13]